jgi:hypothetical protein
MKRRRLKLRREVVAVLSAVQLGAVRAGLVCSDPTCHICDTIKPAAGCAG